MSRRPAIARHACAAALAVASALAFASSASAVTFAVDTTRDGVDASPGDLACASAGGKCPLRAAIDEANATAAVDQINVPPGTFELKRPRDNGITGNQVGDLEITEPVTITGAGPSATKIKQTVRDRVLFASAGSFPFGDPVKLIGLTVTGGKLRTAGNHFGGGIRNEQWLVLEDAAVRKNAIKVPGGNSGGGGIYNDEGILALESSSVTRNRVEVEHPTAGASGGGVRSDDGLLSVVNSRVSRNTAVTVGSDFPESAVGGGIYGDGETVITGSTVAGNSADGGGGIEFGALDGTLTMEASTISGNRAKEGGGLRIAADIEMSLTNSTISGNLARRGSGLYLRLGEVALSHVTVAGNRTRPGHAALEIDDLFDPPTVQLTMAASILANKGGSCGGNAAFTSDGYNVFGPGGCTDLTDGDIIGSAGLEPLAINPGPTPGPVSKTHGLEADSLAIDRVTACPPPATDQRGLGRPQGPECDSGAYERGAG